VPDEELKCWQKQMHWDFANSKGWLIKFGINFEALLRSLVYAKRNLNIVKSFKPFRKI